MSSEEFDYGPFKDGDVVELYDLRGKWAYLNGRHVTIIGELKNRPYGPAHEIDIPEIKFHPRQKVNVSPDNVRRKRPPATGEDAIMALFKAPPVEHRQPVTAWEAQHITAQALMKMGVRVRPGKWPVEAV